MKRRVRIMLLPLLLLAVSCSGYGLKPDKPQAGEEIEVVVKGNFSNPFVEVVYLKENLDFDFDVVQPKRMEKGVGFALTPDTLTSYVIWRIVDSNLVYFPHGEGILIYYGKKPMPLAYYYKGLHEERAIPIAYNVEPKELEKLRKRAIRIYKKGLKYYPDDPMILGRLKIVEYFNLKDERKQAAYLNNLEKFTDSLYNTGDLKAVISAFNIGYFFSFSRTYDYFKYLSENPWIPGALDVAMSYLYQYARNLNPKDGVYWLEIGLNKYADLLVSPSSRIKNILRNYYYSLYYGKLALGDTLSAIKYLQKLREIFPLAPSPYMIEAHLRMEMGTLNYTIIDSLLATAEKCFNPIAYSFNYPFYDAESRDNAIKKNLTELYRIESRYFNKIDDLERAIAVLKKAVEIQGGPYSADYGDHDQLGYLLLEAGKIDEAIEYFSYAIVTGSESDYLSNYLKKYLADKKMPEDSIEFIIKSIIERAEKIKIKAPEFTVETIDGKRISLKDLKGKVVVLNFWATWCGPCRREIPDLNALVEKYKGRNDIVFIAITNDLKARVVNFLSNSPFNYQIAFDISDAYDKYNVKAIPTHVIIDRSGYVVARIVGSLPKMDEVLEGKLTKILK